MGNLRILIVEDEVVVAMHIRQQLLSLNYDVHSPVGSGEKAITISKSFNPDIIILDVGLSSQMTGVEAAKEILTFSNPHFIFTTGYMDKSVVDEIKEINAELLIKPIDIKELNFKIQQIAETKIG